MSKPDAKLAKRYDDGCEKWIINCYPVWVYNCTLSTNDYPGGHVHVTDGPQWREYPLGVPFRAAAISFERETR